MDMSLKDRKKWRPLAYVLLFASYVYSTFYSLKNRLGRYLIDENQDENQEKKPTVVDEAVTILSDHNKQSLKNTGKSLGENDSALFGGFYIGDYRQDRALSYIREYKKGQKESDVA